MHPAAPRQQRVNPSDQLRERERLPQVVVGTALERAQHVRLLGTRGQHEHRRAAVEPIGTAAQPSQDVETRAVGKTDVDDGDIGHEVVEHSQALPERARLADVEIFLGELFREHIGELRLVLDE